MSTMADFVSFASKENTDKINPVLFDRTLELSIADYIISGLKVIESLPYIKFTNWTHITDASEIDIKINRRHLKNKELLKNKDISKIVSIRDTVEEMLQMEFVIDYDGESRYIKKNLLIPAYADRYHMLINGNEVLPQKQIVDMSTYIHGKSVKLKTTLTPIDIYKEPLKHMFESTDGDSFKIKTYILNLFTKQINPLYYYFAKFAVHKTIHYFGLSDIIDVVDEEYDKNINYYFKANKYTYIEVDKRFFNKNNFVKSFTYMVWEMCSIKMNQKLTIQQIDDTDFWLLRLGSLFTSNTKNQINKGFNVLVSFERILDNITRDTLRLDKKNLQSTYSLIRWLIENHDKIQKKDNHDLGMKRIRCNEVTAFYFIQSMSQRINNLLNKRKLTIESIERIFNWNPDELFRLMLSNKNNLLKYDPNINCFDLLNALRFSFLGSQGIKGGKNIGVNFRDIYPSHVGRIDLNGISHGKNTALTGFIVPACKIYGNGFFSKNSNDPDNYNEALKDLKKEFNDSEIEKIKSIIKDKKYIKYRMAPKFTKNDIMDENNIIVIKKRYKILKDEGTNATVIASRNHESGYLRTYRDIHGLLKSEDSRFVIRSIQKIDKDTNGRFIIKARAKINKNNKVIIAKSTINYDE